MNLKLMNQKALDYSYYKNLGYSLSLGLNEDGYAIHQKTIEDKKYQFMRLCYSLTMQGLRFEKTNDHELKFPKNEFKRFNDICIKLPFVNSILIIASDKKYIGAIFFQWAGK